MSEEQNSRVNRWFVTDAPIKDSSHDSFGHDDIADNLYRMITEPSEHRRMIGLFGQFGVGKSTIIELLRQKLGSNNELSLIRMSAERHEPVGFHRAAVYGFAEALKSEKEIDDAVAKEILEPLRSSQTASYADYSLSPLARKLHALQRYLNIKKTTFTLIFLSCLVAAVLTVGLISALVPTQIWTQASGWISTFVAGAAFFIPFIWLIHSFKPGIPDWRRLLAPGTTSVLRPKIEAADEQEQAFALLVEKAKSKLVVAVDDIDRLSKDQILDALNAVRSFQLTCSRDKQPIFIVSLDEKIVTGALDAGDELKNTADAQEFLNRLFTLRQEVPVHETLDLRDYAQKLIDQEAPMLSKAIGSSKGKVVDLLIYENVNDPRHVVRLVNAFSSDLRLAMAREKREGPRSLVSGSVTSNLSTLARTVVLKTDFAAFFNAILRDTELLDLAATASSMTIDDEDLERRDKARNRLKQAGFDFNNPVHSPLFMYISRTAVWVPTDAEILPFMHLGQHRFSKTLGNKKAREIRSTLANNLPEQFDEISKSAQSADDGAIEAFRELIVAIFREMSPLEQQNAASVILGAANNPVLQTSEIARVVRIAVSRDPSVIVDATRALQLTKVADNEDAPQLAQFILNQARDIDQVKVWQEREYFNTVLGAARVNSWLNFRINVVRSWETLADWAIEDLGAEAAALLTQRISSMLEIDHDRLAPPESKDLNNVKLILDQLAQKPRLDSWKSFVKTTSLSANTWSCAIAYHVALATEIDDEQLIELVEAMKISNEKLSENARPLSESQEIMIELIEVASKRVNEWVFEEEDGDKSVISTATEVVSSWIDNDFYAMTSAPGLLRRLINNGSISHEALVSSIMDSWIEDLNDPGPESVSYNAAIAELFELIAELDPTSQNIIFEKWSSSLEDIGYLERSRKLLSKIIKSSHPHSWADAASTVMVDHISVNTDFTGAVTDFAAELIATNLVSSEQETALVDKLVEIGRQGGVNQSRALGTIARIAWSAEVLPHVLKSISPNLDKLENADFWTLYDLQLQRGTLDIGYIASLSDIDPDQEEMTVEMVKRAKTLVAHIDLAVAANLVILSDSDEAQRKTICRASELSQNDAKEIWPQLIERITSSNAPEKRISSFLFELSQANVTYYEEAVDHFWDMSSNGETTEQVWKHLILPLPTVKKQNLANLVAKKLEGTTTEGIAASDILAASEVDAEFDEMVSSSVATAVNRWCREEINLNVAESIFKKIERSTYSRDAARSVWKGKPHKLERRQAYDLAMKYVK